DGNGRVSRLFTHACLIQAGVPAHGLWSMMRGLARRKEDYFAALTWGDAPRMGDLDGRGSLSDGGLSYFCQAFLQIALDQIKFMRVLLDLETFERRITAHLEAQVAAGTFRKEAKFVLLEVLRRGDVSRGDATRVTGLGERTA